VVHSLNFVVRRGDHLIARPAKVELTDAKPGKTAIEAVLFFDHSSSTYNTSQHKIVYLDRGLADGVEPGMVFRHYRYRDINTGKKITDSDLIPEADMQVVHASRHFSTALVIQAKTTLQENTTAVLLTDVGELNRRKSRREKMIDADNNGGDLDDLDRIDTSGGLGKEETQELEQLEKWEGNPVESAVPPPGVTPVTPPPVETVPPQPPAPPTEEQPSAVVPPAETPAPEAPATEAPAPPPAPEAPATGSAAPEAPAPQAPPAPAPPVETAPDDGAAMDSLLNSQ
jgi:hypothetical protein